MNVVFAVGAFLIALGPLIVFHELGHFSIARAFGVRVLRFSIGFGMPLFKIVAGRDRTEWVLAAVPFGGYVAMLDEREMEPGQFPEADLVRAFNRQSVWRRAAIVAAGPVANFLFAIFLYWAIGLYGVQEPRALLREPTSHTLAQRAGIVGGDEVTGVDGDVVRSLTDLNWQLLKRASQHGQAHLDLRRSGGAMEHVDLDFSAIDDAALESDFLGYIGIAPQQPIPELGTFVQGGAAERAGLREGDRLIAINGTAVHGADEFVRLVRAAPGTNLDVTIARAGRELHVTLRPDAKVDPKQPGATIGVIGVSISAHLPMVTVRYGPIESLRHACLQTWDMTAFTLRMLGKMIKGEVSLKNLSGPVTIADYAGQSARLGVVAFVGFIAFISVSIGLMNLLPVPMLDGGHLLYYLVEIVRGRPLSERFLEWGQRAGMAALAGLMAIALFNDFSRLFS